MLAVGERGSKSENWFTTGLFLTGKSAERLLFRGVREGDVR
jgi:hypothetical protein